MARELTIKKSDAVHQVVYGCPGCPGYAVSKDGRVWSYRPRNGKGPLKAEAHELKPVLQDNGYTHVSLYVDGKQVQYAVHALMLGTFVGPCPEGLTAGHKNGVRDDNALSNLYWATWDEQADDKKAHGTHLAGSQIGNSVLTEDMVLQLKSEHQPGVWGCGYAALAKKHGLAKSTVAAALSGRYWKGLAHAA